MAANWFIHEAQFIDRDTPPGRRPPPWLPVTTSSNLTIDHHRLQWPCFQVNEKLREAATALRLVLSATCWPSVEYDESATRSIAAANCHFPAIVILRFFDPATCKSRHSHAGNWRICHRSASPTFFCWSSARRTICAQSESHWERIDWKAERMFTRYLG
jgi:hypothetical protein